MAVEGTYTAARTDVAPAVLRLLMQQARTVWHCKTATHAVFLTAIRRPCGFKSLHEG